MLRVGGVQHRKSKNAILQQRQLVLTDSAFKLHLPCHKMQERLPLTQLVAFCHVFKSSKIFCSLSAPYFESYFCLCLKRNQLFLLFGNAMHLLNGVTITVNYKNRSDRSSKFVTLQFQ